MWSEAFVHHCCNPHVALPPKRLIMQTNPWAVAAIGVVVSFFLGALISPFGAPLMNTTILCGDGGDAGEFFTMFACSGSMFCSCPPTHTHEVCDLLTRKAWTPSSASTIALRKLTRQECTLPEPARIATSCARKCSKGYTDNIETQTLNLLTLPVLCLIVTTITRCASSRSPGTHTYKSTNITTTHKIRDRQHNRRTQQEK